MEANSRDKVKELVSRSRVGMLGTREEGFIRFRPMSHVDIDDDGNIWFFISMDSLTAQNIQRNPTVQLIYANEGDSVYLNIEGVAKVSHDKNRMKELFNPFVRAWFPKGLKDPSIALLAVYPEEMEYWSNDESRVLTYLKILLAGATGPQPPIGDHGTLAVQ